MGILQLRIFDGTRQPFPLPADFLVRVLDGNGKIVWNKDHFNTIINISLNSEGGPASRFGKAHIIKQQMMAILPRLPKLPGIWPDMQVIT